MKWHIIRQKDAMQCGVACLTMICRYYGQSYTLDELEELCPPSREGVSMLALSETATSLGLDNATVRFSLDQLRKAAMPAILHWGQNHFVVLYGISSDGRKFRIADPGKGKRTVSTDEMTEYWLSQRVDGEEKGIVMFFNPTEAFITTGHNEKKPLIDYGLIYGSLKKYRRHFIQIFAGLVLGSILQLVMPFLTRAIVDVGIGNKDIHFVWLVMLCELMIVLGSTATDFLRRWLLLHISMRINVSLVSDFFRKLLKLPMSFFETKQMGDLLQRIGDHSRIQSFLTGQVLGILFSVISLVILGGVLMFYDMTIFLVFVGGSIVYATWKTVFLKRRKLLDYDTFEQQSIIQNKTYQFVTSMPEIKLQDCKERRRLEWEDAQTDLFGVQMRTLKLQQTQEAGSIFINECKNILIVVLAAGAVIDGNITLGTMMAVQYIVGQLNSPVEQIMSFIYSMQDVKISLERISEIHRRKNEESTGLGLTAYDGGKSISVRGLDFRYDPHALKKTLDNMTLDIPEGKTTAIVGASGCGKTTLVKLLLGYYPPSSGGISVGDIPLPDFNIGWWRRHCGVVMQDGVIFSESIARNIAVGDGDIDIDRLEEAAVIANIHDFVMSLPLRYDTVIGNEGIGLSQGQKQRILIARAVYKNPDFIFLDEATNALDAKNEREIVDNLKEFYKERTAVIVAHRLSTVKHADQIIVLDDGKVAETGTHSSLVEKRGTYYALVKNQLELGN